MGDVQGRCANVLIRVTVAFATSIISLVMMLVIAPSAGSSTFTKPSPVSVSFLPSGEGWILSGHRCDAGTCLTVERTMNTGRRWSSISLPDQLQDVVSDSDSGYYPFVQLNIYFANASDGWIYGSGQTSKGTYVTPDAELWATKNGGDTWTRVRARSLGIKFGILSVGVIGDHVFAIGWRSDQTFGLWRSSLTANAWTRVNTPALWSAAGGTTMLGAVVAHGASGWMMVGNDRGVTGAARLTASGQWVKWTGPCNRVGGEFSVPAATSATNLVDVCLIGGYGGYVPPSTPSMLKVESNWIFTSHDGGLTFAPTNHIGVDSRSQWLDNVTGIPASPSPGVIFVIKGTQKGQYSIERLYATRNAGKTWTSVYSTPLGSNYGTIQQVNFASSRVGSAIVQVSATTSILIVSTDGGRTWHRRNISTIS